jgi:hypothetical protein
MTIDTLITQSLRRIPGRGAVTLLTWLAPLLPAAGAILYVTSSSPAWVPIVSLATVISIAAIGPVWWLLRKPLRQLPKTVAGGLFCLIAYANVGLLGGFIILGVLNAGAPDTPAPQMLSAPVLMLTTVTMTMLLSTLVAIVSSWRWELQQAVAIARSRRNSIEKSILQRDITDSQERKALAQALESEIISPLFVAEEQLMQTPVAVADDLEELAGSVVRPLSHRFHSPESTQLVPLALSTFEQGPDNGSAATIWHTLRQPLQAGIPIWLLTAISVPGSILIAIADPLAGWWVPPINLLTILSALALISYIPPILQSRVPPGWRQWLILAGLYTAVGIVVGIVLAVITGQSIIEPVITGISFHVLTGLLASAGRTWWNSTREEQSRFNAESLAMRAEDLQMLAHARMLRTRAAMILHSQVQTRLLAIASLLASDPARLEQARESLCNIRDDVLVPLKKDILSASLPSDSGLDAASLQRAFPGITIQMSVRPAHDALNHHDQATTVSDLLTEAVANAVRHGQATAVTINVVVGEQKLSISVHDNGNGIDTSQRIKPGLGLSAIRAASRRWELIRVPAGGTHLRMDVDCG